jgi:hypothetical protein
LRTDTLEVFLLSPFIGDEREYLGFIMVKTTEVMFIVNFKKIANRMFKMLKISYGGKCLPETSVFSWYESSVKGPNRGTAKLQVKNVASIYFSKGTINKLCLKETAFVW